MFSRANDKLRKTHEGVPKEFLHGSLRFDLGLIVKTLPTKCSLHPTHTFTFAPCAVWGFLWLWPASGCQARPHHLPTPPAQSRAHANKFPTLGAKVRAGALQQLGGTWLNKRRHECHQLHHDFQPEMRV